MAEKIVLEFKIDEASVQGAWLKTLYDLADELNCKCQTFFEEKYNAARKCFAQTRIIKIMGANSMLGWLKLRMERYDHFVNSLNEYAEFYSSSLECQSDEENPA